MVGRPCRQVRVAPDAGVPNARLHDGVHAGPVGILTRRSARIFRALEQLDADETTPSLHVHQLKGQQTGVWTAYASKTLRVRFRRLDDGRKELLDASHHYGD